MKKTALAGLLPALALMSACGAEADTPAATNDDPPALAESADEPVDAPVVQDTPAQEPAAVAEQGAIAAQFIGVWDYVDGTCALESDMRLEITQADFTFYESYGEVQAARSEGEYTIVDLAMEGEGETWTSSERLFIDESGQLHLTDPESESVLTEWPRKRCDS